MQAEQARFLLNFLLPQVEEEVKTTRKVLVAIPEGQQEYRPHPVSKSAMELAWHLAVSEAWMLNGIIQGQFASTEGGEPPHPTAVAHVINWYDQNMPALIAQVKSLSDEQLTRRIPFFGVSNEPAAVYLSMLLAHSIHHRGQLSAYLRPMGGKTPSIYGGSADEPWQPPA